MTLTATTGQDDFKTKVLDNSKLVLVDFWADWCPPCRMMVPVLDNIATKMTADVDVVKVNIEEHQQNAELASSYGVQSIPNLLIFKDGQVVSSMIGMVPEAELTAELKKHI